MADAEIWKDIEGYEGQYQVSNQGRVKSLMRDFYRKKSGNLVVVHLKEHIMKPQKYKQRNKIQLRDKTGKIKTFRVASLVAKAFVPNPDNKPQVDHIIPICVGGTDAAVNLRWVTEKENANNPLSLKYDSDRKKKPILQFTVSGEFIKKWDSAKEAGEALKISRQHIGMVCRGEYKSAGGFIWKFAS